MRAYRISNWAILSVFVIGAGSLAFYLWHGYMVRQARSWPTVEATVTSCDVTAVTNFTQGKFGSHLVRWEDLAFAFSYRVSGRDYISRRFYIVGHPPAHIVAHDFRVGEQFSASYNAIAPDVAVVEPGPLYYRILIVAVLCLGLAAAGVIYNHYQT